ncbi:hypothetical protein EMCRGX_G017610 [Ephydatia muelleri]
MPCDGSGAPVYSETVREPQLVITTPDPCGPYEATVTPMCGSITGAQTSPVELEMGTTQALCDLLPLIHHVNHVIDQVWYADDATATGKMTNSHLVGQASKQSHAAALSAFHDTQITITAEGKPHLGAALGTFTFVQHYVKRKVEGWAQELNQLASIAANNPHSAYAAFTHGLSSKWTFLARIISNISHLMQPLEDIIQSKLIPNVTGRCAPSNTILLSLPLEA